MIARDTYSRLTVPRHNANLSFDTYEAISQVFDSELLPFYKWVQFFILIPTAEHKADNIVYHILCKGQRWTQRQCILFVQIFSVRIYQVHSFSSQCHETPKQSAKFSSASLRLPFQANKLEDASILGFHLEVERPGGGRAAREVHRAHLVEAHVDGRLVHEHEAALERVEVARRRLVRARHRLVTFRSVTTSAEDIAPRDVHGEQRALYLMRYAVRAYVKHLRVCVSTYPT